MWIPGLDSSLAGVPDPRIPAASSPVSDVPADRLPVAPELPPAEPGPEEPAPAPEPASPDRSDATRELEERLNSLLEAAGLGTRIRLLRSRETGDASLRRARFRMHHRHRHLHLSCCRVELPGEHPAAPGEPAAAGETARSAPPLGPPVALGLDRLG